MNEPFQVHHWREIKTHSDSRVLYSEEGFYFVAFVLRPFRCQMMSIRGLTMSPIWKEFSPPHKLDTAYLYHCYYIQFFVLVMKFL
jgi:hypothetical protein